MFVTLITVVVKSQDKDRPVFSFQDKVSITRFPLTIVPATPSVLALTIRQSAHDYSTGLVHMTSDDILHPQMQ